MAERPQMPKEPSESLTSEHGPHAPRRDRRPEHAYPPFERHDSSNRRDAEAPGGPVNIPVKGGAPAEEDERPRAPGLGARAAPGGIDPGDPAKK